MEPLPVLDVVDPLRRALDDPGAAVLVAPPGTGKTTLVPPLLADEPWAAGKRVLVLEPRRLAARLAATRMAELAGEAVGGTYGYSVRGERRTAGRTRVEVLTEGLLLRRLQLDPSLEGIAGVVLDEFHERSLDVDLALALLVDVRRSLRPDLRLLAMSATLDPGPIAELLDAPVIRTEAPLHPVDVRHRPGSAHHALEDRVAEVVVEALGRDSGDVLVFLPGRGEIRRTAVRLERAGVDAAVVTLHGGSDQASSAAVFGPGGGRRRVILSTSVAESSVTVPGVRVVVDAGRRRRLVVHPRTGLPSLRTGAASRASAEQRSGRAGRLAPGVAYRLWSIEDDRHRAELDPPEVLEADLAGLVLQTAAWGVRSPGELAWVDEPPDGAVVAALELLGELGAIDRSGALTPRGRRMAELGFHPRMAAVAIAGEELAAAELTARVLTVLETARAAPVDLVEGVRELDPERASRDAGMALRQWRTALGAGRGDRRAERRLLADDRLDDAVAELLISGFPDRLARRRAARPSVFQLVGGSDVELPRSAGALSGSEWLVVADLDTGEAGRGGRIHLAAPVGSELVAEVLAQRASTSDDVRWEARRGDISAVRRRTLGAIAVDEQPLADPDRDLVVAALLDGVGSEGLDLLGGDATQLRARVACLRALGVPDHDWPDWSDAALLESLDDWLAPHLVAARRRKDLASVDLAVVLASGLDHRRRRSLDRLAPRRWTTRSGRGVALRYGTVDGEPTSVLASARVADLLGTDEHPRVAGGHPVTVDVLSPAGRVVQRTTDLPGFWRGSWSAVRAELRGRYPKHPWPERPWEQSSDQSGTG